jgi:predicted phosphodiesterase
MAKPLSSHLHREIHKCIAEEGMTFEQARKKLGLAIGTVWNYARILPPIEDFEPQHPEPDKTDLPPTFTRQRYAFEIDTPGWWLVMGDQHIPFHDPTTCELAVKQAKKRKVVGILLNGDLLDYHEISVFDKDPTKPRLVYEIEIGKEYLAWMRGQFPNVRIVFKTGNHDDRLDNYVQSRGPALFKMEGLNVESVLHLDRYGIEIVKEKRRINLGRLTVLHGHELGRRFQNPVNPARGLYLKCRSVAICSHFHQSSHHRAKNIKGKAEAAWSVGCACDLEPLWLPVNEWNHGFAFVKVENDGSFSVENKEVENGRVT